MDGYLRVPRSRGAFSGLLLVLLGAWGALIPFVGPYFNYAYSPDSAWTLTSGRIWMEVVPGAVCLLGGLILLGSTLRPASITGATMCAAAGAWFAIGNLIRPLWANTSTWNPGVAVGSTTLIKVVEQIGFFTGLGVAIVFLAGLALGRHAVLPTAQGRHVPVEEPEPLSPAAS